MLILISTLVFWISNPKSIFGQIWVKNSNCRKTGTYGFLENVDSYSDISFLNFRPLIRFWVNLGRNNQSCPFYLKIGTHSILEELIPYQELDFWNFDSRIHFWVSLDQKNIPCLLLFETLFLLILYSKLDLHSFAPFYARFWKYEVHFYFIVDIYIYIYIYMYIYIYIMLIHIYIHITVYIDIYIYIYTYIYHSCHSVPFWQFWGFFGFWIWCPFSTYSNNLRKLYPFSYFLMKDKSKETHQLITNYVHNKWVAN